MDINLVLVLFAGAILFLSAFSTLFQRLSLPDPLMSLVFGVLIGPFALDLVRIEAFGPSRGKLLEEAARLTLAVGLAGVALRLPHGFWRRNVRWVVVSIGLGMAVMFGVATGVLWGLLEVPFLLALLLAAIITPTDPVVTTPIVTGSLAEEKVPERVRHNISAESGLNDGLAFLFVMLPVLLLTKPDTAWHELGTKVLLKEVLGGILFGAVFGFLLAKLFVQVRKRKLMEESAYLGFLIPFSLAILGGAKLLGTNAVLAIFIASAVFGQVIPQRDEKQEDAVDDAVNRFLLLPIFFLLGLALPIHEWLRLGWRALAAVVAAILLRRLVMLWALRPLIKRLHDRPETFFLSWFAPVGVSALFYTTLAERHTGNPEIFHYATLAIASSVLIHGLTTAPLSAWLRKREPERKQKKETAP